MLDWCTVEDVLCASAQCWWLQAVVRWLENAEMMCHEAGRQLEIYFGGFADTDADVGFDDELLTSAG
jgi:hypothetical protein